MFATSRSNASAYSQVHVQTGDPHQLVALLLDGALSALAAAVGAMERRDVAAKGRFISRAAAIVDEGLRGGLDMKGGGEGAVTPNDLYARVPLRPTQANLKNHPAPLRACVQLLGPLRDARAA